MLIFLYGKDSFRSHEYMKDMVFKFRKDRDPQNLNTIILDCEKDNKNVLEQVSSAPFLGERRMIVLKNFLISKNIDIQEELIECLKKKKIPETNVIIFLESTDVFKTKTVKKLFGILSKEKYSQKLHEQPRIYKQLFPSVGSFRWLG